MSPTLRLIIRYYLWHTLRPTIRPSLIPIKRPTPTPLIQIAADDAKDGDEFGSSVSVFEYWSIIGARSYGNLKGRAYLHKSVFGSWNYCQTVQSSSGSYSDRFG